MERRKMAGLIICGLSLALAMPLALVASERIADSEAVQRTLGELEMSVVQDQRVAGSYARAGSLVLFESVREAPERLAATVDLHGTHVAATYDLANQVIVLDGGGAVVFPEDRKALSGLVRRLERTLPATATADFLERLVNFLSQAPAGVVLDRHEIRLSDTHGVESPISRDGSSGLGPDSLFSKVQVGAEACQVDGEDGVRYLAGGCSWLYYNSYHDADNHCNGNYPTYAGCSQSGSCLGRCGGGCGGGGDGSYTTDCKDHDQCCRTHGGCTNPWAADCGDEYWDADDDYFQAGTNCSAGC